MPNRAFSPRRAMITLVSYGACNLHFFLAKWSSQYVPQEDTALLTEENLHFDLPGAIVAARNVDNGKDSFGKICCLSQPNIPSVRGNGWAALMLVPRH
ncbi:uncharacterized protein N7484_004550 [Penicillium longicatenatum]|uniref:uncharacterized protein n=1 Tax=Penicillium longicatenatum TaxID=1561947 RepID=UPI002549A559|nr:uncharacterized protein N7484_004550 [Penicillium longicatenatum]KAJ5650827.1 hypothetical protein N7484_004550 [Penicillium longicatenatum]